MRPLEGFPQPFGTQLRAAGFDGIAIERRVAPAWDKVPTRAQCGLQPAKPFAVYINPAECGAQPDRIFECSDSWPYSGRLMRWADYVVIVDDWTCREHRHGLMLPIAQCDRLLLVNADTHVADEWLYAARVRDLPVHLLTSISGLQEISRHLQSNVAALTSFAITTVG
jgi:hypothetical protein